MDFIDNLRASIAAGHCMHFCNPSHWAGKPDPPPKDFRPEAMAYELDSNTTLVVELQKAWTGRWVWRVELLSPPTGRVIASAQILQVGDEDALRAAILSLNSQAEKNLKSGLETKIIPLFPQTGRR